LSPKKKLKIAMIASECVPYVKTGGLADVVGALPYELTRMGHETIVILPKYASIDSEFHNLEPFLSPLGVWMGVSMEWCAAYRAIKNGIPFYFIESHKFFDRWGYYHDADMNDYLDNYKRFGFFTRAALQLCRDMQFSPDIVHVHDWQTALAPGYLKIWHWDDPILGRAASVLTIHNIAYQGVYNAADFEYLGLQWGNFTADKFEDHGRINFLKGGIHYADMVNTVSPTYAHETLTPEGGSGLAPYLNNKGQNYIGILNGADYERWNPEIDPLIPANYSSADLSGKAICKRVLQERFQLTINADIPVIGIISRLAMQKGLGLLTEVIEPILQNMIVQFVILGAGERNLADFFRELPARYKGVIGSYIGYSNELSHLIEAGSDFFLMPSLFEPCGLNQIYSLKYGTLPIVRATGGLDDTVEQYNEKDGSGTGFKFWEPSPSSLFYTIGWAISTYFDRKSHFDRMRQTAMKQDYSWEHSAQQYRKLYDRAMANKRAYDG